MPLARIALRAGGWEEASIHVAHDALEWPQVPTRPSLHGSCAAHATVS